MTRDKYLAQVAPGELRPALSPVDCSQRLCRLQCLPSREHTKEAEMPCCTPGEKWTNKTKSAHEMTFFL